MTQGPDRPPHPEQPDPLRTSPAVPGDMAAAPARPEGFAPHFRQSPLTAPWEPIFSRRTAQAVQIGLHIREAHCNSRGFVHGGLISALADNAMGLSAGHLAQQTAGEQRRPVTVNLAVDFTGTGKVRRSKAGLNHMMQEKSRKRLRRLRKNDTVDKALQKRVKIMLPYG